MAKGRWLTSRSQLLVKFILTIVQLLCPIETTFSFIINPKVDSFKYCDSKLSSRQQTSVFVDPSLDDEKVTNLYAWISCAFAGDSRYDNLMYAIAAVFGSPESLGDESPLVTMKERALEKLKPVDEEEVRGAPISLADREMASLGAMGAGQWTGQWRTRPHALLNVKNMTDVEADWVKTLPRGVRRTLKKALQQNFTVHAVPILGDKPAPHSSLAHFRCVVAHEVRLLSDGVDENGIPDVEGFFSGIAEGVNRYLGTTRMAGEIREYRDENNRVIAFAHEVRKGRVIRGQWFYATDQASKRYVWFHSVYDLVRRAIEADGVDVVDLGPSGSDAFSHLKERYGFKSVEDWPAEADYLGPFWYEDGESTDGLGAMLDEIEGNY